MAKGKKQGRNTKYCDQYRKEGRRERNKRRKLMRHLKRFPNDRTAQSALDRL